MATYGPSCASPGHFLLQTMVSLWNEFRRREFVQTATIDPAPGDFRTRAGQIRDAGLLHAWVVSPKPTCSVGLPPPVHYAYLRDATRYVRHPPVEHVTVDMRFSRVQSTRSSVLTSCTR